MRIAIVKLSALGDIIHAMVALQFIKARFPECMIDWVVEERFAGVLASNPDIDRILTVNLKALKAKPSGFISEYRKIRAWSAHRYDWVIDAQGLLKSAIVGRLVGKQVSGFAADSIREKAASWFYHNKVHCPYDANTIDRNAAVISNPLRFAISTEQILQKRPFLYYQEPARSADFFPSEGKNIVLVTGSTWESRNYPPERYVEVAEGLRQNCLVVWGNEVEKKRADWMVAQSAYIKPAPRLDLNGLKALIAHSDLVIGNDTGPTHMAWGLNKPSLTLFGPTPVSRVYQTEINKAIKSPSIVNPFKLNKNDFSIRDIPAGLVVEAATALLGLE